MKQAPRTTAELYDLIVVTNQKLERIAQALEDHKETSITMCHRRPDREAY